MGSEKTQQMSLNHIWTDPPWILVFLRVTDESTHVGEYVMEVVAQFKLSSSLYSAQEQKDRSLATDQKERDMASFVFALVVCASLKIFLCWLLGKRSEIFRRTWTGQPKG